MKKKTRKTKESYDWSNPKLPSLEDIDDSGKFLTYDDLVETGIEFVMEDINILEEQLSVLDETSNRLLDCLHMKLPPKLRLKYGSKYDGHTDFVVSVISKIKQIKEITKQLIQDGKKFNETR